MKMWQPSTSRLVNAFPRRFIENGVPATGTKTITFRIFSAVSGTPAGDPLPAFTGLTPNTEETHTGVQMGPGGVFNVLIGSVSIASGGSGISTAVFSGGNRWIEVQVGTDILPRVQLVSVPYAYHADNAIFAASATFATNAGTATFATTAGTSTWATNAGTATWATQAGSVVSGGGGAIPVGGILPYAGTAASVPSGFLLCDGSEVSRMTFDVLFSTIGTAYGAGDGSTTFNLPDLRGRFPAGRNAGDPDFDVLGTVGGTKIHSHGISVSATAGQNSAIQYQPAVREGGGQRGAAEQSHGHTIATSGSASSNTHLPPFQSVNYIIKH